MRADRLLALVMLLRARRRATAAELAAELEVSERTVLRDIEALSSAGVPVYTERGRNGGFALTQRTVDPNGLVCANGSWYLLALHRGHARTYRVARITDALLTEEKVDISAMPSLIEQWEQSRSSFRDQLVEIEVIVGGAAGPMERMRSVATRSTRMSGDRYRLVFADEAQALSLLWRYGPNLVIDAPQTVSTELTRRARAILEAIEVGNGQQQSPVR